MLIKNVKLAEKEENVDLRIQDGKFIAIQSGLKPAENEEVIDGQGNLVLPPYIDSHVHLDTTMTAGQPRWNETGTLFEGINIWSERKESLSIEDVKSWAKQAIRRQVANGIQVVRSHVDVTDSYLTALKALLEVREEMQDIVELQLVAFPQEGILSFPHGKELMEEAVKMGVDALGGIPHYEFTREYGVESLKFVADLAAKNDLLIDVHCDEIDDPQARGLETLVTLAYETGLGDKVTASHTTAMGSYNDAYTFKLFNLLKLSKINFVANPLVNTHLGGRFDTYPKRRGMTRVKELRDAGINVSFGEDDIKDPWYPMGDGDMLDPVYMGMVVGHMMGYTELKNAYQFMTTNAAKTLHITDHYGIEIDKPANFLIVNGYSFYDVLNQHAEVLYSIRNGKIIVETQPKKVSLKF